MSAHHQDRSPQFKFEQSPHRKRLCKFTFIEGGHKSVQGIAWWPGFCPFTIDGSTLNTTRFQTDHGEPDTETKYRRYYYRSETFNSLLYAGSVPSSLRTIQEIEFIFHEFFGDLEYAHVSLTSTTTGIGSSPPPDYDYEWSRADGFYSDSDNADEISGPNVVPWPELDGSDVVLENSTLSVDPAFQSGIPYTGIVDLNATSLTYSDAGEYDVPPGIGEDGDYEIEVEASLSEAMSYDDVVTIANSLATGQTMTAGDQTLSMVQGSGVQTYSLTTADWDDPASVSSSCVFAMTARAQEIVAGADVEAATNVPLTCYNRFSEDPILINGEIDDPEGIVAATGIPTGEFINGIGILSITHFWDYPQTAVALSSVCSIVALESGLFCGNTTPDLYDYELILPSSRDGTKGTPSIGVGHIPPQIRPFPISELQTQLGAGNYGSGWLGISPGGVTRPDCV